MASGLDYALCSDFIAQHPKFTKILDLLFQNTQYYTRQQILVDLQEKIQQWKAEREQIPLFVVLSPLKIGSEYYYYHYFRNQLPPHTLIIHQIPSTIPDLAEFLFLDDWILTGTRATDTFLNIVYLDEDHENPRYPDSVHTLTIITSIATPEAEKLKSTEYRDYLWLNLTVNVNLYYVNLVDTFRNLLEANGYGIAFSPERSLMHQFYKTFNDSKYTAYPIHLDYKIANTDGSFPLIYAKCRTPPVKDFMTEIIEIYS